VFNSIQLKVLELVNRVIARVEGDEGQTTVEYVVVSAVAAGLAIAVIYVTLTGSLNTAVSTLGNKITNWVSSHIT